jgi:hypothetical protein
MTRRFPVAHVLRVLPRNRTCDNCEGWRQYRAVVSFWPDAHPAHFLVRRSRPARALPLGTTSHQKVEVQGAAGTGGKIERFEESPTAPPPLRVGVENQRHYEMDLSVLNASSLRGVFEQWTPHARKVGRTRRARGSHGRPARDRDQTAAIREWARMGASRSLAAGASLPKYSNSTKTRTSNQRFQRSVAGLGTAYQTAAAIGPRGCFRASLVNDAYR